MSAGAWIKAVEVGNARRVHAAPADTPGVGIDGQRASACGRQVAPFPSGAAFDPSAPMACAACRRELERLPG